MNKNYILTKSSHSFLIYEKIKETDIQFPFLWYNKSIISVIKLLLIHTFIIEPK